MAGAAASTIPSWATGKHMQRPACSALLLCLSQLWSRYEGEFYAGFASGLGQYTSEDSLFYGQYHAGQRSG